MNYNSPLGSLSVSERKISFTAEAANENINENIKQQLDEYFAGKRKEFKVDELPEGTDFQRAVWAELLKIPYGQTRTYKEVAFAIGRPKAMRAVGNACNRNPLPIIIPCHRVLGSSGSLTGYAGGTDKKAWLLKFETSTK